MAVTIRDRSRSGDILREKREGHTSWKRFVRTYDWLAESSLTPRRYVGRIC